VTDTQGYRVFDVKAFDDGDKLPRDD